MQNSVAAAVVKMLLNFALKKFQARTVANGTQ